LQVLQHRVVHRHSQIRIDLLSVPPLDPRRSLRARSASRVDHDLREPLFGDALTGRRSQVCGNCSPDPPPARRQSSREAGPCQVVPRHQPWRDLATPDRVVERFLPLPQRILGRAYPRYVKWPIVSTAPRPDFPSAKHRTPAVRQADALGDSTAVSGPDARIIHRRRRPTRRLNPRTAHRR
jgi:hypothetical protein